MASITIITNLKEVTSGIARKLQVLADRDYLLRPVAADAIVLMTDRIHNKGQAADGSQIGTYNNEYLKRRQREFKRNSDSKIIVSATRQLENDWSVIATNTGYGVGFKNVFNAQKARWVEQQKGKDIFSLSEQEKDHSIELLQKLVTDALNS